VAQAVCLLYPLVYELAQLSKKGPVAYFANNSTDYVHIVAGYSSIYCQLYVGTWSIISKLVMMFVVWATMMKTIEQLRVISSFSYIVTMIRNVISDLVVFFIFFAVVIISFSMQLDIFGRSTADEYKLIGPLFGNIFATLRLSLGDYEFTQISELKLYYAHVMFWVIWLMMVVFSSLIFLNFIIAEVGNSYAKCRENITPTVFQERAILIAEAEDLFSKKNLTDAKKFPKAIVVRKNEL